MPLTSRFRSVLCRVGFTRSDQRRSASTWCRPLLLPVSGLEDSDERGVQADLGVGLDQARHRALLLGALRGLLERRVVQSVDRGPAGQRDLGDALTDDQGPQPLRPLLTRRLRQLVATDIPLRRRCDVNSRRPWDHLWDEKLLPVSTVSLGGEGHDSR